MRVVGGFRGNYRFCQKLKGDVVATLIRMISVMCMMRCSICVCIFKKG